MVPMRSLCGRHGHKKIVPHTGISHFREAITGFQGGPPLALGEPPREGAGGNKGLEGEINMMMFRIAFRNIFRQKRRTVLTALSMFGGFVLAAFFIGWSDGIYNGIIDMFTRNQSGHIQVHHKDYLDRPSLYKSLDEPGKIEELLKKTERVEAWAPRLYSAGLASVGEKTAGVKIIGIEPEKENRAIRFSEKVTEGKLFERDAANETVIGKGLAKLLKAGINDDVVIVSQGADGSIANDMYKIVGIVESGDELSDRMAFYLPMAAAGELLVMEGRVHEIAITVTHLDDVETVNAALSGQLKTVAPDAEVQPWQVFARSFYMAMKADKEGMWIMLVVIVLVVAVGVLNTVLMSVLERRREYGVLKAVGTKPGQIVKMVLMEVNILSVICILLGIVVGLVVNYFASAHGYTLSEAITYGGMSFQTMKAEINFRSFYIPAITVFFVAMLVSIFPALKAAHTDPAKSMRTH
jgi:putative ABC transport system permease protein